MQKFHSMTKNSVVLLLVVLSATTITVTTAQALANCPDRCGDLIVPFPFGIAEGCYLRPEFFINCSTDSSGKKPVAYLRSSGTASSPDLAVTSIAVQKPELRVLGFVNRVCDHRLGRWPHHQKDYLWLRLPFPFAFSTKENRFYAVGCTIEAHQLGDVYGSSMNPSHDPAGYNRSNFINSFCEDSLCEDDSCVNRLRRIIDSCFGLRCSQMKIPNGVQNLTGFVYRMSNTTNPKLYDSCSYFFLAEHKNFTELRISTSNDEKLYHTRRLPVIVDWKVGNETCEVARKRVESFACKGNSTCVNQPAVNQYGFGGGYICKCLQGYHGNPYHPDGCRDIDECKGSNRCISPETCLNLPGNYTCVLPKDKDHSKKFLWCSVALGTIVLLVAFVALMCLAVRKQNYIKLKQRYFEKNGGLLLQQQLSRHPGAQTAKIFTAQELEKATNNYHESRVLGEGGYGIVYKGILPDNNTTVAIKKSKAGSPINCSAQFVNEVIVLSQINHINVVRLLGCCLETPVPLLVYEFITNGTLYKHIHQDKGSPSPPLSWKLRLKIATETAGALAYLHSSTSTPILHRDVKTMNILLDDNYTAKMSDFGSSRLIRPADEKEITTLVQGTLGYLDPEYLQSNQITEKSDVYSFGVVLVELLTSKDAFSFARPEKERTLAGLLVSSLRNGRLDQILDKDIFGEIRGNEKCAEVVEKVAYLAERCFRLKGEERPSMKEVAMELEGLRAVTKLNASGGDCGTSASNGVISYDSMRMLLMEDEDGQ